MSQLHVLNCATNFVPSPYMMKMRLLDGTEGHYYVSIIIRHYIYCIFCPFTTSFLFFCPCHPIIHLFPSLFACFVFYFLSPLLSLFLESSDSVLFTSFRLISTCSFLLLLHFPLPLFLPTSLVFSLCVSQVCT